MKEVQSMKWTDHISTIKGIGEKTAQNFAKLGIYSVCDLIEHYPRGYDVYEQPVPIASISEGSIVAIEASVATIVEIKKIKNLQIISCRVKDPSGMLSLTWFNQAFLKNTLRLGNRFIFRGKVVRKNGALIIQQPKIYKQEEYRKLLNVMQPIYSLTDGLSNHAISKAVDYALTHTLEDEEYIPKRVRKEYDLIQRKLAIREIHFPKSKETMMEARKRLVFEEFFNFTLILRHLKENKVQTLNSFVIENSSQCRGIIEKLPYELTGAQKNVLNEIFKDLSGKYTMNRLVQGDVGSGKTILAVLALYLVAINGYQGCLMVPTEVLAKQHYESLVENLSEHGIRIKLLVGSMTAAEKRRAYEEINNHETDIIVGTHALIQEKIN